MDHPKGSAGKEGSFSNASRRFGKAGRNTCWNTDVLMTRIERPAPPDEAYLAELLSLIDEREACFRLVKETNAQIEKLIALRMSGAARLSEEQLEKVPLAIEQLRENVHVRMQSYKQRNQHATPCVAMAIDSFFRLYSEERLNGRKMSWGRIEEILAQLRNPSPERENSRLINRVAGIIEKLGLGEPLGAADQGFFLALAAVHRKAAGTGD